jgi:hypothetical protein
MIFKRRSRFNKFNAKRTASGFPSKLEEAVYHLLLLRERNGELTDIRRQHAVVLQEGPKDQRISWKVDFSALDVKSQKRIFVEAKGIATNDFVLKLKLWRKLKPFALEIWKGDYRRPYLAERIDV